VYFFNVFFKEPGASSDNQALGSEKVNETDDFSSDPNFNPNEI
jgi:hypothetical protein